ncbi:MAG: hypothetical protein Q9187_002183 [Circinaria calcarea]
MGSSSPSRKGMAEESIAVIGSSCRFPGSANSPSKLWELLREPHDVLTTVPKDRFNPDGFYHPNGMHHGTSNVTESYFLQEDHRVFDAGFFNIKPVEAHSVDPQQRLLLETVYESLESAGITIEALSGSQTGVYVGLMCGDYSEHLQRDINSSPTYMPTGTARSIISNRVSYFFNWHGPSMTIDTACSSSLVAVHQAVQLLRSGDSEVAVAAGANLILGPELYIGESKLHMLSPGSRSRMWDADADGYARGEGIASVVMKRLSTAIKDGDHIECVIRETGVNQDGRTRGITMPSQIAQANLIAKTYAKAGLDPQDPNERCQYFEAHGTGTSAGDACEAEAISKAFFAPDAHRSDQSDLLYVGSIKTVVGHTEGTAGLAGLLKASLAVQHGIIPPNLLFNTLSPAITPFYSNLEIATTAKQWPEVAKGSPRRASVNSFGFGGTNAHAIIENFVFPETRGPHCITPFTPFTFSAASDQALQAMLVAYSAHIQDNPALNLRNLSYTLHARRSVLPVRAAFSAISSKELASKIEKHLEVVRSDPNQGAGVGLRLLTTPPRVLGVFTGQGAQWATMGRQLVLKSDYARKFMDDLDHVLKTLPEAHRPSWSFVKEILADSSQSRIDEAIIAQPVCTAIQILLVDLLRSAGVRFKAVVGHSSGEIAAAYAAGVITCHEAVKIAYYRGLFTKLAGRDKQGAMMAVGTSFEDATELCNLPSFENRLCVAACNSSSSVTLSGDSDAIEEAKIIFEEEKKFARVLKVEKAYHSHHMIPCSTAYVDALHECHIEARQPVDGCTWFSSTYQGTKMEARDELTGTYWRDNMINPVLFSQAVEAAIIQEGPFNIVIEVGPHPALKEPVLQAFQDTDGQPIPYTGMLSRSVDEIEAVSEALGFIWTRLGPYAVNFDQYDALVSGSEKRELLKFLPKYQWDHDRIFWHESRASRVYRARKDRPHPLLGSRITDEVENEMRWRNLLRPSELPWLHGHRLQGQIVFPAAGYIATAVEASKVLANHLPIGLIEVCDFVIGKPLTFDDDESGAETVFTLSKISKDSTGRFSAAFTYHACTNQDSDTLTGLASGRVLVIPGEPSTDWLPPRSPEPPNMVFVNEDQFYSSLDNLGYGYTEDFRALSSMKRKLNYGSANVSVPRQDNSIEDALLVHPAMLDAAFQAIFLAYWWPNDGSLDQLHVPTSIQNIRINVPLCQQDLASGMTLPLSSHLTENPLTTSVIHGDVDIFGADGQSALIQVEGVKVVSFSEGGSQLDHQIFSEHVWDVASPDGKLAMAKDRASKDDYELATLLERVSLFYLKRLDTEIKENERQNLEWHHESLFEFASHVLSQFYSGRLPYAKKEWVNDTWEQISAIMDRYPDSIEMKLTRAVGENLPSAVRGETNILQHLLADNLLNSYYTDAMGLRECTDFLAKTIAQVVHRYPHMEILEIGAGTGGATKSIMKYIGRKFSSYTYTDISPGFFEAAQEVFAAQADKMVFKVLDAEKDVVEQGYKEHSFDLVIGSLVLHATSDLKNTMENTRRLLKPGGYLVILEITNNDVLRTGFAMSGLPGWWLGRNDGRRLSPCVSSAKWHSLLLNTGFSGIDSITPEIDTLPRPLSVITAQAVDEQINFLREPLSHPGVDFGIDKWNLVVLGGQSLRTIILIDEVLRLLQPWDISITCFKSLSDIDFSRISSTSAVLSVTELDNPIFKDFTNESMNGLKRLFESQRTVLWITQGCRADEPYMNMTVGFGRSLTLEMTDVRLQFFDLDISEKPNPRLLAEALLRLRLTGAWENMGNTNNVLWSTEQELVHEKGRLIIPRLVVNQALNDRYNASKRTIIEKQSAQASAFRLQRSESGYDLVQDDPFTGNLGSQEAQASDSKVLVKVSHSILLPIAAPHSIQIYSVFGTDARTEQTVLGFSAANSSHVAIEPERLVQCRLTEGKEARLLSLLEIELKVDSILSFCGHSLTLLLHEPAPELAARLCERALEKSLTVVVTTSSPAPLGDSWITIHPHSPSRTVKAALPPRVSVFIDCSVSPESKRLGSSIASCLPGSCLRTTLKEVQVQTKGARVAEQELIPELKCAASRALVEVSKDAKSIPLTTVMKPEEITRQANLNIVESTVVDWSVTVDIPLKLSSIDGQTHFADDKTYILFGLTSDLGLSLCDWMVSRGARNLVLTSRNPKIDSRWLKQIQAAGVSDITDQAAVEAVVSEIRRTFPPIAGIAHGAMVLEDASFFDMSFETMEKVLRPKVQGCIHLNELFQEDSLDFFILFSSLAAISGNRGQSNYSAANMFLAATAFQRRSKGLAASVLHIGAVMGVGYVTREVGEIVFAAIHRAGFKWMSERGFHQCIAEAIRAGRPGPGLNPEIVTGLRIINTNDEEPAPWMNVPRFQHCLDRGGTNEVKTNSGTAVISVKIQLLEVSTQDKVFEIVKDAFFAKLQIALQLPLESVTAQSQVLSSGADELGVDSLVAVEVRSWFLKELEVDMPVLKILGGATIVDLLMFAIEKLPAELTPNLGISCSAPPVLLEDEPQIGLTAPSTHVPLPEQISSDTTTSSTSESTGEETQELSPASSPPESMKSFLSIPQRNLHKVLPMSPGQSSFWFLRHLLADQTTSNITFSIRLQGSIRLTDLENAVKIVGARHEALRTCFFIDEAQKPMQGVLDTSPLHLETLSIGDASQVSQEFKSMKEYVFDIERGETMRVLLLCLTQAVNFLVIGYHHINMDGASLEVFLSDLEMAYNHRALPQPAYQYGDYSSKLKRELKNGSMKDEMEFWRAELADHPPPLPLLPFSLAKTRASLENYNHNREDSRIDADLAIQIRKTCHMQKANVFHFYLAVYEVMLFRLLNTSDLCIGMATANRNDDAAAKSMGIYLNLLPLRFRLSSSQRFGDVLKETRRKAYSAMANARLPFDTLLEDVKAPRSTSYSPLFQAFINYRQGVKEERSFGDFEGVGGEYAFGRTAYDISLDILDNPGSNTLVMFMVQKQLYSASDAKQLAKIYFNLLKHFSESPKSRLDEPSLFAAEDISNAIQLGQGLTFTSEWPETLAHRVDDIIVRQPNSIALKDTQGNNWTYQQMKYRINSIAAALLSANVTPTAPVAVFQEPTPDWICSMLAVMRIGAIYVPLDINIPVPRLALMLETCHPSAILVHDATAADAERLKSSPPILILNISSIPASALGTIQVKACAKDPAAILYTSGTTGIPKGVILSHSSLRNQIEVVINTHKFGSETVLQQCALSFDLSLDQVFTALSNGGLLIVAPRAIRGDPIGLVKVIVDEMVTYTSATPSEYLSWLHYGFSDLVHSNNWKFALSVGEQYPLKLYEDFREIRRQLKGSLRLFNVYGPTEVTVSSNRTELSLGAVPDQRVPAGHTLPNCSVYIVDEDLKPVPIGVPGEVCVGGAGVAIGYLNNDEQAKQKFVSDAFMSSHFIANGWTRIYRTGDRGMLREDGALEIHGRIHGDTQIKLRGIRIEIEDIENTILRVAEGALAETVVTPQGEPPILIAHAVFSSTFAGDSQSKFLQQLIPTLPLPQYMRPAAIIPIKSMPLSLHGKIDRRALERLPIENSLERPAPSDHLTATESRLRQIWEEVLWEHVTQVYSIDADSDFFHVGGNSMLLIKLQGLVQDHFNANLSVMRLFECSTLRAMAVAIQDSGSIKLASIDWEGETALPEDLLKPLPHGNAQITLYTPRIIILTGSTGFLGKEILRQLIVSPNVDKVHCIAVRTEGKLGELLDSGKVVVHTGDLGLQRCGLSAQAASSIFNEADAVIHNGADVSFLKSYQSMKPSNVESTKEIIKLLRGRKIPVHYVSSVAVGRLNKAETFGETSLASFPPPPGFADSYAATKWASEIILEKAHARLGIPIWIHRPSSITGEEVPEMDVMNNLLKFARLTKSVPESNRWKGYLDFISVAHAASGILKEVLQNRSDATVAPLEYLHQSGDVVIPMDSLKAFLENESGTPFEGLALREWIERAKEHGLNGLVAEYLSAIDGMQVAVVFQKLVKTGNSLR